MWLYPLNWLDHFKHLKYLAGPLGSGQLAVRLVYQRNYVNQMEHFTQLDHFISSDHFSQMDFFLTSWTNFWLQTILCSWTIFLNFYHLNQSDHLQKLNHFILQDNFKWLDHFRWLKVSVYMLWLNNCNQLDHFL